MLLKFFKLVLILLFYQIPLYSKSKTLNDYNSHHLSNYFSGIVAFENKDNSEALKFFKASKFLIKQHNSYLEKYIYSLVLEGKIQHATNEIKQILSARDIAEYFIGIHGSPEKKSLHITKIISKYNYHPDELIFYGDANTDINAAKQASVPFILIKNSYNQDLVKNFKGKIINNFIGLT